MKTILFVLLIGLFIAGCIYETPQAVQLSTKEINSTSELSTQKTIEKSNAPQDFNLKTTFQSEYTIKSVPNYYDGCNGCMDYLSTSLSSMQKYSQELEYPYVASISGALCLKPRHEAIAQFLGERIINYGFKSYLSSYNDTDFVKEFYSEYKINRNQYDSFPTLSYLKALAYSNVVPIVSVDRYYLFDIQSKRYLANFTQGHKEIFIAIPGYTNEGMLINDPTIESLSGGYQTIPFEEFLNAWESTTLLGKRFSFFFVKINSSIETEEALKIIAQDIMVSHENLKKIVSLDDYSNELFLNGYESRKLLYEYLKEINIDAALKSKDSSINFKHLAEEKDLNKAKEQVEKIIKVEKEMIENLK